MKYILLYGDKMYFLSNLLNTSNEITLKKVYLQVYNYLCYDNIESVEALEAEQGEIEVTSDNFIERLFNTIIEADSDILYSNVISIYK